MPPAQDTPFQCRGSNDIATVDPSNKSIVLIGMMGAGKSSVGRCLQQRTGLARFDTDELATAKFGISIPEIFATHGEETFREAETEILRAVSLDKAAIIVTGGGIVLRPENIDLLKKLGVIVWLDANEETLFARASRKGNRPLLQADDPGKRFSEILKTRAPIYEKAAEIRVDTTDRTHDEVSEMILGEMERRSSVRAGGGDTGYRDE